MHKQSLFLVLLTLLISCSSKEQNPSRKNAEKTITVDCFVVSKEDFSNYINTVGTLKANEEVELKSPVNGIVQKINFIEGKNISKGQLLIQIDTRDLQSKMNFSVIKVNNLKKEYERKKELYKIKGISLEELEKSETDIANETALIEQYKVQIDYSDIKAPFSGKIGLREISPGAYLLVGDRITKLVNLNPIKVEFSLPAEFVNEISVNSNVQVISKSLDDTVLARIYAIDPSIDISTRNIRLKAEVNNSKGKFIPGDFVEIKINLSKNKSSLFVPAQAIVPNISEQTVFVVKNGIARETVVQIGKRDKKNVQILSGLDLNDTILVTGLVNIRNNTPVNINQIINK
ncbi:MAG: hypothetical protein A2X64_07095 [Ignavibacteria bacterium GWF2_33_9]|nr:MAG: hypothetical protein A2X64_07095 [Ignavibacteria bacterium GWF2_33_9]